MENYYDPELEAEAAMKLAVAVHGAERQKWIRVAIAWQELARERERWTASPKRLLNRTPAGILGICHRSN